MHRNGKKNTFSNLCCGLLMLTFLTFSKLSLLLPLLLCRYLIVSYPLLLSYQIVVSNVVTILFDGTIFFRSFFLYEAIFREFSALLFPTPLDHFATTNKRALKPWASPSHLSAPFQRSAPSHLNYPWCQIFFSFSFYAASWIVTQVTLVCITSEVKHH